MLFITLSILTTLVASQSSCVGYCGQSFFLWSCNCDTGCSADEDCCFDYQQVCLGAPSESPTMSPTRSPTKRPTSSPTKKPTLRPTRSPTKRPTTSISTLNVNKETAVKCEKKGYVLSSSRYKINTKYSLTTDDCWKECWNEPTCKYAEFSHSYNWCELYSGYSSYSDNEDYDLYSMNRDGTNCPEEKDIHPATAMAIWMMILLFCCLPVCTCIIGIILIYKCCCEKPTVINNVPPNTYPSVQQPTNVPNHTIVVQPQPSASSS
jgi:hypothetical protein